MDDAKILLAEEIKSILRKFDFIGEIVGPQESKEYKSRTIISFGAYFKQDSNYNFYRKTHFAHCHALLPAVVIRWGI